MNRRVQRLLGVLLIAPGMLIVTLGQGRSLGDEPGLFGRLFRFGGPASATSKPTEPPGPTPAATPPGLLYQSAPATTATRSGAEPRLLPRPRVTRPVTDADPLVTRVTIGRSDNGAQFAMFLLVYADGTVLDSEGIHHAGAEVMRPVIELVQSGELLRLKGHCGGPSTDFVEQVQMVVYERSLGRLRANSFSFSGNPDGCDNAVRRLHTVLDALQASVSRTSPATAPTTSPAPDPAAAPTNPIAPPSGSVIPLTPIN